VIARRGAVSIIRRRGGTHSLRARIPINSTHAGTAMNDDDNASASGESAVALPSASTPRSISSAASARPGTARGLPEKCPRIEAVCTLVIDPRWARALTGIESCNHLVVLYWMNRSRRDRC
jgi:hypothetical protein